MDISTNDQKSTADSSNSLFRTLIKDSQWLCITILVILFLLFFGNKMLNGLHQSGIQKLTLAGNSIEFKTQEGYSYILTLPANQYWLSSDISVNTGSSYTITVSGMVSTGMGKNPELLPGATDYDFSNRNFQGKLEYPDLVNTISSLNKCTQILSDSIKIKQNAPYGSLLVGVFTEDEIDLARRNPWKFSERIITASAAQKFTVHYTSKEPRWDISEDKPKLFVNSNKFILHFIVNDSVIPDLEQNASSQTQALYAFVTEKMENTQEGYNASNVKILCDSESFTDTHKFLEPSLHASKTIEKKAQSNGYGPRALWFLDNKGVFTIVVDNKDN